MNITNRLHRSKNADKIFKESITKVFAEIELNSDDECLEINRTLEKEYLLGHVESAWLNLAFITQGLKTMGLIARPSILDIGTSPLTFIYR